MKSTFGKKLIELIQNGSHSHSSLLFIPQCDYWRHSRIPGFQVDQWILGELNEDWGNKNSDLNLSPIETTHQTFN